MTTAADFLKADKIMYDAGLSSYSQYMNRMANAWDVWSAGDAAEEARLNQLSAAAALALFAFPAGLILALRMSVEQRHIIIAAGGG